VSEAPAWRGDIREAFEASVGVREPPGLPDVEWLVRAAVWYAENGLPVFPLQPGTKLPYPGTRGVLDATTDLDTIGRWWRYRPDSNLGLATGHGIDVIDFDGPAAHQAWLERFPNAQRWGQCADLFALATVHTPRPGGLHVYVDSTGDGNRAGLLGKGSGVDYRGLGGYVVAPPSHTHAGRYLFIARLDPATVTR